MAWPLHFGICVCVKYTKNTITGNGIRIHMKFHLLLFHFTICCCGFPFVICATNCFLIFIGNRKKGKEKGGGVEVEAESLFMVG